MTDRIFADIAPIKHEGPDSRNMLAYRYYDPNRQVLGKSMAEHLRLAVCYWHSFAWPGNDIFGVGTFRRPWNPGQPCSQEMAELKLDNAFDFFERLGVPFFTFHDVDAMATADTPQEHKRNLALLAEKMQERMERTGVGSAVGHREPVLTPALCRGRRDKP